MKNDVFLNISKIIERDSKATTYKFALLRGLIDVIQENSPYLSFSGDRTVFPTGLLIEKWLLYYYPILDSSVKIPQINGETNLAFGKQFKIILDYYKNRNGYSAFYNDLRNKGIPKPVQADFILLVRLLKNTITNMPMRYIGRSFNNNYYSIFQVESSRISRGSGSIDTEYLINNFGTFSIPTEYFEAFKILGSFITGQDSILFKWAEFAVNASNGKLSFEKVVNEVLKNPVTERDVEESKKIYKEILRKEGKVQCVWTGDAISSYDIDHVIPFSIWKNNDLWNLLPAKSVINNKKRDKIPSVKMIENNKDLIIRYWELLNVYQQERFQKEISVSLLGNNSSSDWHRVAINQLKNSCDYLITTRGYEEWNI